jgi:hypothetical protein
LQSAQKSNAAAGSLKRVNSAQNSARERTLLKTKSPELILQFKCFGLHMSGKSSVKKKFHFRKMLLGNLLHIVEFESKCELAMSNAVTGKGHSTDLP